MEQKCPCNSGYAETWIKQMAGNLTDPPDGVLNDLRYVLVDRDTKF